MAELENTKMKDVERSHSEGHVMVITSGNMLASNISQPLHSTDHVDFTDKYSAEIAENLLLAIKHFVHIMTQKYKYKSDELRSKLSQLEAREDDKLRMCGELQVAVSRMLEDNTAEHEADRVFDVDEFSAWRDFRLHLFLETAIWALGFKEPTPIQKLCIPAAAHIGAAETGSGKTLAFELPILQERILWR